MICYLCGRREARIEGLCEPCFLEQQPPLFFENLKILTCRECGNIYFKAWRDVSLEHIIEEYINLENAHFQIEERGQAYSVTVVARQMFHEGQTHPLVQQTQFLIHVKESLCGNCSKMLSGYYEAVLQVRRQGHVLTDAEKEACSDIALSTLRRNDFISRIRERKEGVDLYFSSAKAAKRTAEILRRRLGGSIKESYKTVGLDRQTYTDIKRGTILFSLPGYKPEEMVLLQNSVYRVSHADQKLHLKNAEEERVLPWKEVEYLEKKNQISVLSSSNYQLMECQVLDVTPSHVLVMRPDFTTVYLERPKGIKVDVGMSYRILFFQEHAYWM